MIMSERETNFSTFALNSKALCSNQAARRICHVVRPMLAISARSLGIPSRTSMGIFLSFSKAAHQLELTRRGARHW